MSTFPPQIKLEPTIEDEAGYHQTTSQNLLEIKEYATERKPPSVYVNSEKTEKEIINDTTLSTEISVKSERGDFSDSSGDDSDGSFADQDDENYVNPLTKPKRIRRKYTKDIVELIIDKDVYICGICKKTFRIRGYAIRHIESHKNGANEQNYVEMHQKLDETIPLTKKETLWCQRCDKYFKEHAYLVKHLRINRCKGREDLLCKTCNAQFFSYNQYNTHLTTHESKKNQCEICTQVFRFKKQLQDHYSKIHNNPKPFKCDLCLKTFAKRTQLSGHLVSHSNSRPYSCKKCGKRFKHKQNVKKHIETHNREVNLTCKLCQKTFPRESRLRYHMRTHDKKRPFVCDLCQKSFSHKNNVLRHLMYKHPHTLQPVFVKEFKSKLRNWAAKRYYSKHVMESLKYCIYKGNKLNDLTSIPSDNNFDSIGITHQSIGITHQSIGINQNATDISQNCSRTDLIDVKNELNSQENSNLELVNSVSIKTEPKCREPECILGAD